MTLPKHPCLHELGVVRHSRKERKMKSLRHCLRLLQHLKCCITKHAGILSSVSSSSVIESRSTLYKQLSELRELQNVGALTADEYQAEKDSIMKLLLQPKWLHVMCVCMTVLEVYYIVYNYIIDSHMSIAVFILKVIERSSCDSTQDWNGLSFCFMMDFTWLKTSSRGLRSGE